MKHYYKIVVVRGHSGRGNHNNLLTFYFEAQTLLEASDMARRQPGVKHTMLPRSAREVSYEEYLEGMQESAYERGGISLVSRKIERRLYY